MTAAVNVEAIKLQLIRNQEMLSGERKGFVFSEEAIRNMVKALEFADTALSSEIETFLTKSGKDVIPEVVKGLGASSLNVKSTCAMVLIRLGQMSVPAVKDFFLNNRYRTDVNWVAEFVLRELGTEVPAVEKPQWDENVVAIGRVG